MRSERPHSSTSESLSAVGLRSLAFDAPSMRFGFWGPGRFPFGRCSPDRRIGLHGEFCLATRSMVTRPATSFPGRSGAGQGRPAATRPSVNSGAYLTVDPVNGASMTVWLP